MQMWNLPVILQQVDVMTKQAQQNCGLVAWILLVQNNPGDPYQASVRFTKPQYLSGGGPNSLAFNGQVTQGPVNPNDKQINFQIALPDAINQFMNFYTEQGQYLPLGKGQPARIPTWQPPGDPKQWPSTPGMSLFTFQCTFHSEQTLFSEIFANGKAWLPENFFLATAPNNNPNGVGVPSATAGIGFAPGAGNAPVVITPSNPALFNVSGRQVLSSDNTGVYLPANGTLNLALNIPPNLAVNNISQTGALILQLQNGLAKVQYINSTQPGMVDGGEFPPDNPPQGAWYSTALSLDAFALFGGTTTIALTNPQTTALYIKQITVAW